MMNRVRDEMSELDIKAKKPVRATKPETVKKPARIHIHIVGPKRLNNDLLRHYLEQSINFLYQCSLNSSLPDVRKLINTNLQSLILWDCHDISPSSFAKLLRDYSNIFPSSFSLAFFNAYQGQLIEEEVILNGCRGVFYENDTIQTMKKGINAILNGELWFSRGTLSSSLSSFMHNKKSYIAAKSLNIDLTRREKEILRLIASGSSNDEIANNLCISPLTVKTHIRNIFRKINIPNRIQAILWVNKNRLLLKE